MNKLSKRVSILPKMWPQFRQIEKKRTMKSKTLSQDSQEFYSRMFKNQRSSFSNQNKSVLRTLIVRKKLLFNQLTEPINKPLCLPPYLQTDPSLHSPYFPNQMKRKVRKRQTRLLLRKNKKCSWSQQFQDQEVRSHETLFFITLLLINTSLLLISLHLLIR